MKSLIFVVDREAEVCEFSRRCLEPAGYRVQTFSRMDAYSEVQLETPALMLVGVDAEEPTSVFLPGQIFAASRYNKIPCIALLDSKSADQQRMVLDAGADDCLLKPLNGRELLTLVRSWLQGGAVEGLSGHRADIVIDSWAMKVLVRGIEISTTALEFRLVEYLARHRGQVFTRDFLLDAVWGDMRFINPRSVDACIRRVREKIEPDRAKPTMLKTIRGVGYRLDAITEWQSAPNAGCNCPACRSRDGGLSWQSASKPRRPSAET